MTSMTAAVIEAPGRVKLERAPAPAPGAGEVLVRIEGCGICGSDLAVWQGRPWFEYPLDAGAPGHEPWGRVEAVGDDVHGIRVGGRVAAISHRAHAELDVAPADAIVPLPEELDGVPFPGEALGCAANVFRRSDIAAGDTVAVVGVGFLGAVVTSLAARAGADVIAISRRSFALEMARAMGAAHTVVLDDATDVVATVRDLNGGELCDRVVEAAGLQRTLDVAAALTRVRGKLVIAGFHQDGPRTVDMQMWNWRGLDVVNAHERDTAVYVEGVRMAVEAVVAGHIDLDVLLTHRFPLDRLGDALEAGRARPDGFLKAWVQI